MFDFFFCSGLYGQFPTSPISPAEGKSKPVKGIILLFYRKRPQFPGPKLQLPAQSEFAGMPGLAGRDIRELRRGLGRDHCGRVLSRAHRHGARGAEGEEEGEEEEQEQEEQEQETTEGLINKLLTQ